MPGYLFRASNSKCKARGSTRLIFVCILCTARLSNLLSRSHASKTTNPEQTEFKSMLWEIISNSVEGSRPGPTPIWLSHSHIPTSHAPAQTHHDRYYRQIATREKLTPMESYKRKRRPSIPVILVQHSPYFHLNTSFTAKSATTSNVRVASPRRSSVGTVPAVSSKRPAPWSKAKATDVPETVSTVRYVRPP